MFNIYGDTVSQNHSNVTMDELDFNCYGNQVNLLEMK
jgi:hypothetical protein